MEHLKMKTADMASENFEKLKALFPNCVTESLDKDGNPVRAIDKDLLMQEINSEVVEGQKERYQFNWPGKRDAIRKANAPTTMTLRPCKDESVDFDNTQNLYIEGDNLEVLKLLQNNYLGKVKMIYIDPPYNTGNDFVYNDNFKQDSETFLETSGMFDEDGNMTLQNFEKNSESNGRFHTDWLNMMYPRLKVARNLLSEDGVIFISIDDNEQENLKKICDEVFGQQNFVAELIWERAYSPKNDARFISNSHDYVLMYGRDIEKFTIGRLPRTEEANARYLNPDNDPRGVWKPSDMSVKTYNADCDYPITTPSGRVVEPPAGRCWRLSKKAFLERLQDNRIYFGSDGNSVPCIKRFLSELKFDGMAPTSILFYKEVGHSQEGAKEVVALFGDKGVFDGPKPVRLLRRLLTLANLKEDSIVVDFFSGSASTAHALLQQNAEKNTRCKFILVQLPELVSETKKYQGFSNICEIGKERIRRAGKKIKEESGEKAKDLDIGFRVLKLAESNMNDVYYKPADIDQGFLDKLDTNIKRDRTPMDLLFQVMLECDLELSSKIEEREINGKKVFFVNDKELVACFDENIDEATITEIAKLKPYYFVMRDSSLATDNVADNFEQLWNAYSKDTIRKVL
ncbi:site-specific DNA-methyltransferase [Hallerella succinigenes]|uniref:site-specific DNA-methyltransferase (adenine-specific) n=1 Tax=Hallerella succinigenes TaxID=1896222 RepID=A0A2M9A933_9BACT|nr:site-specific DNA-methyltransferase [Hallerella succinigenes]PJJ42133.1 adenine-specific DNA-methyltransferase [Hallerella succinigenes]